MILQELSFSPRSFPAVGTIFSEPRNMDGTLRIRKREAWSLYRRIKKRSLVTDDYPSFSEVFRALRDVKSKKRSVLVTVWNILQRFKKFIAVRMYQTLPKSMKRIVKKLGRIEAKLHKKIVCLRPRLERRYGRLIYPEGLTVKALIEKKRNFFHDIKFGDAEDDHVEFIEDCFEDMERPKFGWRVKVTLMEEEPCIFNTENPELSTCRINSTRTSGSSNDLIMNNAQRRQTLEEFRSAAPTDCRIRYIC